MKRVLVVGFLWPYITGSARVIHLSKYLHEFNWEPVILTPDIQTVDELPFRYIGTSYKATFAFWKKLFGFDTDASIDRPAREQASARSATPILNFFLNRAGEIIHYPDAYKKWKAFAIEAADTFIQEEGVDAIVSVWPVTSHIIAGELKRKYKVFWIADLPDLWSLNHNYHYSLMRKFFDTRLEKKTLAFADVLTTVSEPWAEKLHGLHPKKPVYAVTHGFDPEDINIKPGRLTEKFTITYTGSLYTGNEDLDLLLDSLKELIQDGTIDDKDIQLRFYGRESADFKDIVNKYKLNGVTNHYGLLPRKEIIPIQRESQILLVLNWEGKERAGYQLKLFEYLAARRPVLATGGIGNYITQNLLEESGAGVYTPRKEDVKDALERFYREYKETGGVKYQGIDKKVELYSYWNAAGKFAHILDGTTADTTRLK